MCIIAIGQSALRYKFKTVLMSTKTKKFRFIYIYLIIFVLRFLKLDQAIENFFFS